MLSVTLLLVLLGCIGAFDDVWFHLVKERLHQRPGARREVMVHMVREVSFAAEIALVACFRPQGAWYAAALVVFSIDAASGVLDILLEPASRRPAGGLSGPEYVLHMICASLSGGAIAAFLLAGGLSAPTALAAGAVPLPLRSLAAVVGSGAFLLALVNGALLWRPWSGACVERLRPADGRREQLERI